MSVLATHHHTFSPCALELVAPGNRHWHQRPVVWAPELVCPRKRRRCASAKAGRPAWSSWVRFREHCSFCGAKARPSWFRRCALVALPLCSCGRHPGSLCRRSFQTPRPTRQSSGPVAASRASPLTSTFVGASRRRTGRELSQRRVLRRERRRTLVGASPLRGDFVVPHSRPRRPAKKRRSFSGGDGRRGRECGMTLNSRPVRRFKNHSHRSLL